MVLPVIARQGNLAPFLQLPRPPKNLLVSPVHCFQVLFWTRTVSIEAKDANGTSPVRHVWRERGIHNTIRITEIRSKQRAKWCMKDNVCNQRLWKGAKEEGAKTGIGRCFGTFGELLQGVLPGQEREFLVTLPVARYSTARFTAFSGAHGICVYPSYKEKSRRLAEKLMHILDLDSGGFLSVQSELPAGKGCASSSADMVATARAIQSAFGVSISRASLAQVMSSIEPSDGVMYRGIVSFYHREGVLRKFLGYLPSLTIVGIDEGGQVDTVEFNKRSKPLGQAHRAEYESLLPGMEQAVAHGDLESMGEISTRSAVMNQGTLPKNHLDLLLDMRRRYRALGVVAAHSGTQLGLLLDPDSSNHSQSLLSITNELSQYCPDVRVYRTHHFPRPSDSPMADSPVGAALSVRRAGGRAR